MSITSDSSSVIADNPSVIDSSSSVIDPPGGIVVPDFDNFYQFGDGGLGFLIDTAGNQDIDNVGATQVTAGIQGEVAELSGDLMFDFGWPDGAVDKAMTIVLSLDTWANQIIFRGTTTEEIATATTDIDIIATSSLSSFDSTETSDATFFSLGVNFSSGSVVSVFINGLASSDNPISASGLLNLNLFSADGKYSNFRVYSRLLTSQEFLAIDGEDRKVA